MDNQMDQMAFQKAMALSKPVTCDECGGEHFTEVLSLRRVSKLLTGKSKDDIQPIPILKCAKCGHVNEEFQPIFESKDKKEDTKKEGKIITLDKK